MGKFTHSTLIIGVNAYVLATFYHSNGTKAIIFQDDSNICAICDDDDEADLDLIQEATDRFQTIALLCQVFDSSVFIGTIYNRGIAIDEYIDYPDYLAGFGVFGSIQNIERALTIEERAAEWAKTFGVTEKTNDIAEVFERRDDYTFAEDYLNSLLEALGLPTIMVGATYSEVEEAYNTEPEFRKLVLHANGEEN